MELYTKDGWLDVPAILAQGYPFTFVTGGRGTGKTYGALRYMRETLPGTGRKFLFLRRTQAQIDLLNKPAFSPFKAIDRDLNVLTITKPVSQYSAALSAAVLDGDGHAQPDGEPFGLTAALSTFSNLRGFDGSDVDYIVYDEFIPQRQERPIKEEYEALANCYETVNRNRELAGEPPVQLLGLSNANDMGNNIYVSLGLVVRADKMLATGREIWTDDQRGIMLVVLQRSPISDAKSNTALYRLNGDNEFSQMALGNSFSKEERSRIARIPPRELLPTVRVGEITISKIKGRRGLHVSCQANGSPPAFGTGPKELERFRLRYRWIWQAYMDRRISFSEYLAEILLVKYFKG